MTAGRLRTILLGVVFAAFLVVLPAQAMAVAISGPAEGSTVTTNSVQFTYSHDHPSMFWCSVDGDPGQTCSPWEAIETSGTYGLSNLSDGPHALTVSAATPIPGGDPNNPNLSYSSATRNFIVDTSPPSVADTTAPDTTLTQAPARRIRVKRSAEFEVAFASTERGSTFTCKVDDGAAQACASPASFKLRKGKHTIAIAATDAAGNTDASPAFVQVAVKKKHGKHSKLG